MISRTGGLQGLVFVLGCGLEGIEPDHEVRAHALDDDECGPGLIASAEDQTCSFTGRWRSWAPEEFPDWAYHTKSAECIDGRMYCTYEPRLGWGACSWNKQQLTSPCVTDGPDAWDVCMDSPEMADLEVTLRVPEADALCPLVPIDGEENEVFHCWMWGQDRAEDALKAKCESREVIQENTLLCCVPDPVGATEEATGPDLGST